MPVVGKTAEEIATRAGFFEKIIETQLAAPAFSDVPIQRHPAMPQALAECYFALSQAYKRGWLSADARTDPTKIAALTCATISYVRPLHPPNPANVEHEELLYVNEMMGMRASCAIIEHPFYTRAFDDQRRFFKAHATLKFPSIDPIILEAVQNNGQIRGEYDIVLSKAERGQLDHLINKFTVLRDLRIIRD